MKLVNILLQSAGGDQFLLALLFGTIVITIIVYFASRKKNILTVDNSFIENKRYPALRTIAATCKTFAFIIGLLSALTTIFFLTESPIAIFPGVITLMVGALLVLTLLAASESILVFIDVENNTREAAMNSKNQH